MTFGPLRGAPIAGVLVLARSRTIETALSSPVDRRRFLVGSLAALSIGLFIFPGEQYQALRSWTERAYPKLIYYNKVDKGGHFAAWEQPELFAAELRSAFSSLRPTH